MDKRWWGAVVMGTLVLTAACAGSEDSATDAAQVAESSSPASGAAVGASDRSDASGAAVPEGQPVATPREVASTAQLTVVAKGVDDAAAAAEAAATARGGFVFGQQDGDRRTESAVLTLKVPAAGFRPLLADLGDLGKVESKTVTTDDVSAEGADLDARLVSAQKSVDRVRGFLDETKNVNELAALEAELTRRETALEQLQGQRRVLDDRVALATITLTLNAEPAPVPKAPDVDSLRDVPGFGGALASAWGALVKVGRVAAAGAGYALPFVLVFGSPLLVVRRTVRRRRMVTPPPVGA